MERKKIQELMEQAYQLGMNQFKTVSERVEAMKAYASLSLALHNMPY